MSDLATLKADIADDFARTDLTTRIDSAIARAIEHYQSTRFWFNETRDETWNTIIGQPRYNSAEDAAIPKFVTLDSLFITVGGQNRCLRYITPERFELLNDNSASQGEPYGYTYFDITFGLYPIPGDVYTVRPLGHIQRGAPATDVEANNVWMTHGYQLIRSRAAAEVAAKKVRDYEFAQVCRMAEEAELDRLLGETSKRIASGQIKATSF